MKRDYIFSLILAATLLLSGCEKSLDDGDDYEIIPPSSVGVPSDYANIDLSSISTSKKIHFAATEDWSISIEEQTKATGWISVSPMSGSKGRVTLEVTLDPNNGGANRESVISIISSEKTSEIVLTQRGKDDDIDPDQEDELNYDNPDFKALVDFYESMDGDNWKVREYADDILWFTDRPISEWSGIYTNDEGRVRGIELKCAISGTLPESIGAFSELDYLRINDESEIINDGGGQLTGELPKSIGGLSKLEILEIIAPGLTGEVPASIFELPKLRNLSIVVASDQLKGSIPESIGNLTELEYIRLEIGGLTGSIPESIGNLSKLRTLQISGPLMTGVIPQSIFNLTELEMLGISANADCKIPDSIGNLKKLKNLLLWCATKTSTIPEAIGNLKQLRTLHIIDITFAPDHGFIGSIPNSIGNLTNLEHIQMVGNNFSGGIPESIGNLKNLHWLELADNNLSGSIPESIGNLENLYEIFIPHNSLTGSLPASIANLSSLDYICLQDNQLSGSIAPLGNLKNITNISLDHNNFSGSVPQGLLNLESQCGFFDLTPQNMNYGFDNYE